MITPIVKVAAIIIKNKKILMVTANRDFYWTPGGKVEAEEKIEQALVRELKEELNIEVTSFKPYVKYLSETEEDDSIREVNNYFIEYKGNLELSGELTDMVWFGREDFVHGKIKIQNGVRDKLIPALIKDNLI
ncbi:MAG: NUDIX domain-containing protein [Candidatus Falkowbacteria bacterium]|nr:NUDIX domain-containing protein [Candidatus Falkowbacteria bacterium]